VPAETLRKGLDQKWRNQLNASERNGLVVVEGTSDDLFDRFAGIYHELLDRKRFETTVDIEEFRRIQRALPEPLKMTLMLCEKDGRLMSGLVASAMGDTGIYLLGATSAEGMKSKGSYLLQWRMMQRFKERGCRWYDLGGINPDKNPGVYHFKQGFGGHEALHWNRLELSGSWRSSLCVSAGERMKSALQSLTARLASIKAAPAPR
jgi:lipid II:glycine glycyltransferase (peptidoglycan interpeptide bridge formation enzyme)